MDHHTSSAVARIEELRNLITNNKQELNDLDSKITSESQSLEGIVDTKYNDAQQILAAAKVQWTSDHAADMELTLHFAETANRQCLDTLNGQNDETLNAQRSKLYRACIKEANQELISRANELKKSFEDQLMETLQADGDTHASRLEQMILAHKEEMGKLQAQLPK